MTREEWLMQAVNGLANSVFGPKGYEVPAVRVSIGFTGSRNKKAIGSCWSKDASSDGRAQIFIVPTRDESGEILSILVHELVHAIVGNDKGHGKVFKQCAERVGLEGKMTATIAGAILKERLNVLIQEIGEIPHAKLNMEMNPKKKEGTRLLKATCPQGYTVRVTRKWAEIGLPTCPCCDVEMQLAE